MATAGVSRKLNLTRDQLAAFLTDHQQIKQFELLFSVVDEIGVSSVDANYVYAGPSSGAPQNPKFRQLVPADIPALPYVGSIGVTAPITSTGGLTPVIGITGSALTKINDTNVTITLGGSPATSLLSSVSLALGWTGQLSAVRGGTGQSSYAVGDILYADTTTSLAKLPDVATGNALISGGVGVAPTYGKIGLTTHISGILPFANQTESVRSNQVLTWLSI
jgi:hypothetical protein